MKSTTRLNATLLLLLINVYYTVSAAPLIDPIKFSIGTQATHVGLNEEFQIDIKASYMYLTASTVFVFEGSNAFRLKLVLPDGFEQTGGTFSDFVGAELSSAKPHVAFTVKGKFTRNSGDGVFQLLRSHRKADNQSTYIAVSQLSFKPDEGVVNENDELNARVAATAAVNYIPYLTIAQLRAGVADTASSVFITDEGRSGLFKYNRTSTATDDGAMTLVAGTRRYERVYEGAVNVRWFGVVADGTNDQSAAIQKMLDNAKYRNVFFPKGSSPYKIKSIRIWSNSTLTFEEGTIVEGMGTLATSQKMMFMYDASNITIKAPGVIFRDLKSKYTSGQHRHIFSMEGVADVVLEGMAANDSGGDGFYVGSGSVRKISENIKLVSVSANNNRRQGLSITSVRNIDVINSTFTNTNGEGPQAGIDIEPSNTGQRLEGIRISNPVTGGNKGPGIVISPGALAGTGYNVEVTISNHIDDGSQYGMLATTVRNTLSGTITIQSPIWKNAKLNGFVARNWSSRACSVMLLSPTVINCNSNASTSPTAGAAFYIHREANDTGDTNIGNIHIIHPTITDQRETKLSTRAFSFKDWNSTNKILNCSIVDPIKSGDYFPSNNMIVNAELSLSDANRTMLHELGSWNSLADYTYYRPYYTNEKSVGPRNITLGKVNAGWPEVTVEVKSANNIYVIPNATDNIMPLSATNGKWITSKVVGSRLRLRKTSDNTWTIVEKIGTWTVVP
ncbi:hypothetical protein [Dyadobacter crusticola]|uniref:hypothetical protein n=1 Tax=Dyadobacter crusticola TaxID=292407 RepID=UPI00068E5DFB|nr:hypothetical protein [Dyadobacter crusticola]